MFQGCGQPGTLLNVAISSPVSNRGCRVQWVLDVHLHREILGFDNILILVGCNRYLLWLVLRLVILKRATLHGVILLLLGLWVSCTSGSNSKSTWNEETFQAEKLCIGTDIYRAYVTVRRDLSYYRARGSNYHCGHRLFSTWHKKVGPRTFFSMWLDYNERLFCWVLDFVVCFECFRVRSDCFRSWVQAKHATGVSKTRRSLPPHWCYQSALMIYFSLLRR